MCARDLFFEPEAFAMLQYAVEAQVVHCFAMQQALLHHRRSSQESGCLVLESTAQCIPPNDVRLRESGRWAAGPIAIGQVPQDSDNWWMPRAVVLVPNAGAGAGSPEDYSWQDHALVRLKGQDEGSGWRVRAAHVERHPYWAAKLYPDCLEELDPAYEYESEASDQGGVDDGSSDSDDSEDMDWGRDTSDNEDFKEESSDVEGAASPLATYQGVRDAIERDATAEPYKSTSSFSLDRTRAMGWTTSAAVGGLNFGWSDDEDSADSGESDDDQEAGTDYARFLVPPRMRFSPEPRNPPRHNKWRRGNFERISRMEISRLAGRGGVEGLAGLIFDETRATVKDFLFRYINSTPGGSRRKGSAGL